MKDITDFSFFLEHPDRNYRIRLPTQGEFGAEFMTLGYHQVDRRRVLVKRVDRKRARIFGVNVVRIPFLAFADETIEDSDKVLDPIFRKIMTDAATAEGREVVF